MRITRARLNMEKVSDLSLHLGRRGADRLDRRRRTGRVERLGGDGWRVLAHGRDRARGERAVAEIKDAGGSAEFLAAYLSSLASHV